MSRYFTTEQAQQDIIEIATYIARDSLQAADRFIDRIHRQFEVLADTPQLGRSRSELTPSLRSFPLGNYLGFYRPIDNGVEIIRVLSGYRDLDALFDS